MAETQFKTGSVDVIPEGEFDRKSTKIRISIFLDGDVLDAARAKAATQGIGYQTLINQSLRELYLDGAATSEVAARFEAVLEKLSQRLGKIEAAQKQYTAKRVRSTTVKKTLRRRA